MSAQQDLKVLFVKAAQAHHAATGGVNVHWADWYAEHLVEDVNQLLGTEMSVERLSGWLTAADQRYQSEDHQLSWPHAYADWMLEETD